MARRKKGIEVSGGAWCLIVLLVAASYIVPWASGHPERWALLVAGLFAFVFVIVYSIVWVVLAVLDRNKPAGQQRRWRPRLIFRPVVRLGKGKRHLQVRGSENGYTSTTAVLGKRTRWNSKRGGRFDIWGRWTSIAFGTPHQMGRQQAPDDGQLRISNSAWQPIPGKPGELVAWIEDVPIVRKTKLGPRGGEKTVWVIAGREYTTQRDALVALARVLQGDDLSEPEYVEGPYPWEEAMSEESRRRAAEAVHDWDVTQGRHWR